MFMDGKVLVELQNKVEQLNDAPDICPDSTHTVLLISFIAKQPRVTSL